MKITMTNKKRVYLAAVLTLLGGNATAAQDLYGPDYPGVKFTQKLFGCLLYTSPSPRDATLSRMPASA